MARNKTICVVKGCDQPRMTSSTGQMLTMCHPHQQADWRKRAAKKNAKKMASRPPKPESVKPPRLKKAKPEKTVPTGYKVLLVDWQKRTVVRGIIAAAEEHPLDELHLCTSDKTRAGVLALLSKADYIVLEYKPEQGVDNG